MLIAETILAPLRAAPLFRDFHERQVHAIAAITERRLYKPGDTIAEVGSAPDGAIVIAWGEAFLLDETSKAAEPVPVGSVISEMAMFVELEASATIVARSAVRALSIPRHAMLAVLAEDPDMADRLVECVAGRLRSIVDCLGEIEGRLAEALDISEIRQALVTSGGIRHMEADSIRPH